MRAVALLALAAPSMAALVTSTLPDGNTVVLSISTDAEGDAVTKTVSTIGGDTAATTTTKATTTKTTATHTTTKGQVVDQAPPTTTTADPMHTTTYWYEGSDGVWVEATWSNSFVVPTVATVIVPAGTIQDYAAYQESANSVLYAAAESSNAASSAGERRASVNHAVAGWTAMAVGMAGAAWGVARM
ncbi:hypothetical protein Q5752_001240 [Cryptotrichosporon argae]